MTTMESVFLIAGMGCGATCLLFLRRVLIIVRLVLRGERSHGWCVRRQVARSASTSSGASNSHPEFTFAFRTSDGETVEFKDRPGAFGYEKGAPVRVCYDAARPHKRATIAGPDTWGPVYVRLFVALPVGLVSYVALTTLAPEWGFRYTNQYEPYPGENWFKSNPNSAIVTNMGRRLVAEGCGLYRVGPGSQWSDTDRQSFAKWQQKLGYSGADADGWPGKSSWEKLHVPKS